MIALKVISQKKKSSIAVNEKYITGTMMIQPCKFQDISESVKGTHVDNVSNLCHNVTIKFYVAQVVQALILVRPWNF